MTRAERIREYVALLTAFVGGDVQGPEFGAKFLAMRREDITPRGDLPHKALEDLFWDVEDYCEFPELKTDEDIDEEELRIRAARRLIVLLNYLGLE